LPVRPYRLPPSALIAALLMFNPAVVVAKADGGEGPLLTALDKIEVAIVDGPAQDGVLELDLTLESRKDISARLPAIRARILPECIEFTRIEASRHRAVNVPLLHRRLTATLARDFPEVSGLLVTQAWVRPQ